MDIIGDILPIIFVIFALIGKVSKKKENKPIKKDKPNKTKANHFPSMEELRHMGDRIRKTMELPVPQNAAQSVEKPMEEAEDAGSSRTYHGNEREQFQKEIYTSDEIRDVICDNEIGNEKLSFDKGSIQRGIIMGEILGKPKSLRP